MDYYAQQRARGEAFEGYIAGRLVAEGHVVTRHAGRLAQIGRGDLCVDGVDLEVKLDERLAETGNLYIETAEKRARDHARWIPSGVRSVSSARWYGIGNYRDWFVFERVDLFLEASRHAGLTITRGTSQGFLLSPGRRAELLYRERHWFDRMADGARLEMPA
jgi:hypothetical protein